LARVFVLNGVKPGSLGGRRLEELLHCRFPGDEFRHTDHEGEFVRWIRAAADSQGSILNPGAWAHYSCAVDDALETVSLPKGGVHHSDVHPREEVWRHTSVISPAVDAVVGGMGVYGYRAGYILSQRPGDR
jgi:3-dehydroquinate dehydratase-2